MIAATNTTTYQALGRYRFLYKAPLVNFLHYIIKPSLKPCKVVNAGIMSKDEVQGGSTLYETGPIVANGSPRG